MELWIRSQDKERLIKVSTLFVEYNGDVDPTISPYRIVADKCIDLGIYKTKERALEVLDEIQDKIAQNQCLISLMNNFTDVRGNEEAIGELFKDIIYEMPKD